MPQGIVHWLILTSPVEIIKNNEGNLSVHSLKLAEGKPSSDKEETARQEALPMQIDLLELKIDKLVYKDYSKGEEPAVQEFDLGINKTYENITSAQQLATILINESMQATIFKGAKVYGAAGLLGGAFLPAGAAVALSGKDSVIKEFTSVSYDKAVTAAREVVHASGKLTASDVKTGAVKGIVDGAKVAIKVSSEADTVTIKVSARKMLLPKPEIAGQIMNEISRQLE